MLIPADDPAEHIGLHKADDGPVGKHIDFLMGEFQGLGSASRQMASTGAGSVFSPESQISSRQDPQARLRMRMVS